MTTFETILLDVDTADRVATITLNRPDRLNAFNRTMCEEMVEAWRTVKLDDSVNAVVLRAAGDRAFSAGLDIKHPYGQPANVWNHEDPGEPLSPKWQKMWKPVVCAVHGMCTAGAFYFVNESDVVICSTDATFFDSHVSAGLVSRAGADRADAPGRAGRDTADRADGQQRTGRCGHRTSYRIGVRSGLPRTALAPRARARRDDRRPADRRPRRAPCGRSGNRSTSPTARRWSRDSSTPGLATRSGRPNWLRRTDAPRGRTVDPVSTDPPAQPAHRARTSACNPTHPPSSMRANGFRGVRSPNGPGGRQSADAVGECRSGSCCTTARRTWRRCSGCCWPADASSSSTRRVATIAPAPTSTHLVCRWSSGNPTMWNGSSRHPAPQPWCPSRGLDDEPKVVGRADTDDRADRPAWGRGADADQRNDRAAQASRPHLRHAGAQPDRRQARGVGAPTTLRRGVAIVNRPTGAHRRRVPGAAVRRRGEVLRIARALRMSSHGRDAVAGIRPRAVSLVPAALRMVLHVRPHPGRPGRASAPSRRAPRHCPPTTPTPSRPSTGFRY